MKKVLSVVICAGALVTGCSPTEYEVVREIEINAPASVVFDQVNTHKNRDAWSPWEAKDPQMEKSFEGPESGVGAIYRWSGNDSVGTGSLEILESVPHSSIKSQLVFTSPWESTSTIEWTFAENEGKTVAVWKTKGELPGYLFWMTAETMDEMMGPDFESGLAQLKEVCENSNLLAGNINGYKIEFGEVQAHTYYFVEADISMDELDEKIFDEGYQKVFKYLGEDAAKVNQPPFAIFHVWDEEAQRTQFEIAVICDSGKKGNNEVKRGRTYAGDVVMSTFTGPYELTGEVHEAIHEYLGRRNIEIAGSPWESYVVGPSDSNNPEDWQTVIYYPVSGDLAQAR